MDLADLASTRRPHRRGPECGVRIVLDEMSDEQRELLAQALANPFASAVDIARAVDDLGFHVSDQTVARHRRKICRCAKG